MAEGEGFEPSRELITPYSLSRRALSAAQSSLRVARVKCTRPGGVPSEPWIPSTRSNASPRCSNASRAGRYKEEAFRTRRRRGPRPSRSTSCASSPSRDGSSRSRASGRAPAGSIDAGARRRGARVPRPARGRGRARRRSRCRHPRRARGRPAPALRLVRRRRHASSRWRARPPSSGTTTSRSPTTRPSSPSRTGSTPTGCASSSTWSRASTRSSRRSASSPASRSTSSTTVASTRTTTCSPSSTSSSRACTRSSACREQPMTDRMVAAMANPHTDILGHCTGRMVAGQGPARVDVRRRPRVRCVRALRQGGRDQLPSRAARPADAPARAGRRRAGCKVSIDSDAHAVGQLEWQPYGCARAAEAGVARRRRREHVAGRPSPRVDGLPQLTGSVPERRAGVPFRTSRLAGTRRAR